MRRNKDNIMIHEAKDFESMRKAGAIAAEILDYIAPFVTPGRTGLELNNLCHQRILEHKAIPAPLNYKGFPKSVCISVNHVVCHGVPNERVLKNEDIVNIDVTTIVDGWHGDTSRMFWVGKPSIKAKRLTQVAYEAMMTGIEMVRPGITTGDIGHAIQSFAESHDYSVVRDYCGHGVGKQFHMEPNILHFGKKGEGEILEEGMFFTVEPMVNVGKFHTKIDNKDGWTVTTRDRSLSAQFEHSIGVTATGYEIFTLSPKNYHFPPYNV